MEKGNLITALGLVVFSIYILSHLVFYFQPYLHLGDDVTNVCPTILKLKNPDLFPGETPINNIIDKQLTTSPLYFYLLAYPLSYLFSPLSVMKVIGTSLLLFLFIGGTYPWESPRDWLRGGLLLVVVIHLVGVNPFHGNRRSFAIPLLIAFFAAQEADNYILELFILALATAFYPPVALLLLVYEIFRFVYQVNSLIEVKDEIWKVFVSGITFVLVLSPYLSSKFLFGTEASAEKWVPSISYNFSSLGEVISFLYLHGGIVGKGGPLALIIVFVVLLAVQLIVISPKEYQIREEYCFMFLSSVSLWIVAHILYPLIYFPFKYTRYVLPLVLIFTFLDNIYLFAEKLTDYSNYYSTRLKKYAGIGVAIIAASYVLFGGLLVSYSNLSAFLRIGSEISAADNILYGFIFGLPVFVYVLSSRITSANGHLKIYIALIILTGFLFYPHGAPGNSIYPDEPHPPEYHGRLVSYYSGLFETLQEASVDAMVVGPPRVMDLIPAFGRRNAYFRSESKDNYEFIRERIDKFEEIYYAEAPMEIRDYLLRNGIDYLLVNKELFNSAPDNLAMSLPGESSSEPILKEELKYYTWKKGSFYLLSVSEIEKNFNLNNS